jgi:hypothetical protein
MDTDNPITNGDYSCAIVYRMSDRDGSLWQSTPAVFPLCIRGDGIESGSINASGQWIRIPTLRHLIEGTTAQIEIYLGEIDLQLFRVIDNDPTIDYIDFCPQQLYIENSIMPSLTSAIEQAGVGATLYTTGQSLPNDIPPALRCATVWRNRAIGAFGTRIYPSQEFAEGIGIQWASTLNLDWLEGTGDITAIVPIDWNYLAAFKEDAIGIISGPGPDGVGHNGYIVQTISTKHGVTNPKSVGGGPGGAYFQSGKTDQIMVITPQLAVEECTKGWFNSTGTQVTAFLFYDVLQQVWFPTANQHIIVLDYRHKTQSSPFGQTYDWDLTGFGQAIAGIAMIGGVPTVIFVDGKQAVYVDSSTSDTTSTPTTVSILQKIKTGEMQPFGLAGSGDISSIQMLGEYISAHVVKMTTYPDFATSGTSVTKTMSAGPEQVGTRPPNCQRVQSLTAEIEELSSTGKGFKFVGFAMEVQPRSRTKVLGSERMI